MGTGEDGPPGLPVAWHATRENTAEPGNAMNHLPRMEGKIVQGIIWMWVIVRKSVADLVMYAISDF